MGRWPAKGVEYGFQLHMLSLAGHVGYPNVGRESRSHRRCNGRNWKANHQTDSSGQCDFRGSYTSESSWIIKLPRLCIASE